MQIILYRKAMVFAIIVLFIGAGVVPSISGDEPFLGDIVYVDDDADSGWYNTTHVRTISEGVSNVSAGGTIQVLSGNYNENVIIDKSVNLIAENDVNVSASYDDCFEVMTADVNISGFTFVNGFFGICVDGGYSNMHTIIENNTFKTNLGIKLHKSNNCVVHGNEFQTGRRALWIIRSKNADIQKNNFISCGIEIWGYNTESYWITHTIDATNQVNGKPVIFLKNTNGGGYSGSPGQLILANVTDFMVNDTSISNTIYGITLGICNNIDILNSTLTSCSTGIFAHYSDFNVSRSEMKHCSNGIYVYYSLLASCNDCNFTKNGWSINIYHSSLSNPLDEHKIGNCDFYSNNVGVSVCYSDQINVHNCTFIENDNGVRMARNLDDMIVENCDFVGNIDNGILIEWVYGDSANIIRNNKICNSINGIGIMDSTYTTLHNNTIYDNDYGIYLCQGNYTIITNNTLNNLEYGTYLLNSENNTLSGNTVTDSNISGLFLNSSNNNLIYNNYFNTSNNSFDNGTNIWNITKTSGANIIGGDWLGGNYWSDYTGVDTDGDGLGNTNLPYNCSGGILNGGDMLPLVLSEPNDSPVLFDENPVDGSTDVERPPSELDATVEDPNSDTMDVYIMWKNHDGNWVILETYNDVGNGTYDFIPSGNDWIWGDTTYTWSVNVTDGTTWTNETYEYTTGGSRYDVSNNDLVNFQDAGLVWIHRTSEVDYDGIYDVNQNGVVNFQDAGLTWVNRD